MNRLKKEELRKYKANRQGKTAEEITEINAKEEREELRVSLNSNIVEKWVLGWKRKDIGFS